MDDPKLPGLQHAVDDGEMQIKFAALWSHGRRVVPRVRHRVLKHAVGKRCVIEYWLEWNESAWGMGHGAWGVRHAHVIGKLYRNNRGEKIFQNMRNLWEHFRNDIFDSPRFGMPEPLAYLPELGMVVQSVVPGKPLFQFSESDDLPGAVRLVARNLATLHDSAIPDVTTRTMDDHIKKYCHPGPGALIEACPDLAPLVAGILNGLASAPGLSSAPVCPVHGDLGLFQIFITADRAFFIDFDGLCRSHAALDISNFLIALKVYFAAQSDELTRIFFTVYLERQSREMLSGLRVYQALIYLRRAMICFRKQAGNEWRQQARLLLEAGNAALHELDEFGQWIS